MVIPESIIPCGIKLIFFDYDDTLFVHYAAHRFGDDDEVMRAILSEEAILPGSGYRVYENLGIANPLMKRFVEEDAKNIDKLCITWVADSIMVPAKKTVARQVLSGTDFRCHWDELTGTQNANEATYCGKSEIAAA